MFDRPILLYSEYCSHCAKFIDTLVKHHELFEAFVRVNVDIDPATRGRPQVFHDIQHALNVRITEVPTIIINQGEYILSGIEAFKWLDFETSQSSRDLEGFNPNEMGSFSDSYSQYGSNELNNATEQTFKFIHKPDVHIQTPLEESVATQDDFYRKQKERESFDNVPNTPAPKKQKIQFTSPDFPGQSGKRQISEKQKDVDARLQQLLAERERF